MPLARNSLLSKSRFTAGLQCLKRLYLERYARDLIDPITVAQQAVFESGTTVGELARDRFVEGHLIEQAYDDHSGAVISTENALADTTIPAIYEAAFAFDRIRIRIDILVRNDDDSFTLVEVKSTTRVKEEHIPDAAIQLYVARGAGLEIRSVFLLHIDNRYVYEGGRYDLTQLFHAEDITDRARSFVESTLPAPLAEMREVLHQDEPPDVDVGRHCTVPYTCQFYQHCHQGQQEHDIQQLPRASQNLLTGLQGNGIADIRQIPSEYVGLSATQQRVRDSVISGKPYVGAGLADVLRKIIYPVHFLDFETFNPALPLYPGTRPYQVIAFQWSLHLQNTDGSLNHDSFLHRESDDPRDAFVVSLMEAVESSGTIVVYGSFEKTRISDLATTFPRHADWLLSLSDRFLDLHALLRAHYYHPEFHGSYSVKSVLPALVPELGYGDLDIQDGTTASAAFAQMTDTSVDHSTRERISTKLLDYCQRDTLAMVRILEVLKTT